MDIERIFRSFLTFWGGYIEVCSLKKKKIFFNRKEELNIIEVYLITQSFLQLSVNCKNTNTDLFFIKYRL